MIELKEGDVYEGQIEFSTSGNASLTINKKEIFVYKKNTTNSLHLDKVKVQIFKAEKKLEGKVIEVIEQPHQVLCCILYKGKEALIPIHEESVEKIDQKNKKIFVVLPDGLLEIYE